MPTSPIIHTFDMPTSHRIDEMPISLRIHIFNMPTTKFTEILVEAGPDAIHFSPMLTSPRSPYQSYYTHI